MMLTFFHDSSFENLNSITDILKKIILLNYLKMLHDACMIKKWIPLVMCLY